MEKVTSKKALEVAYKNLYNSDIKHIDRNLDNFLKAKKIVSQTASKHQSLSLDIEPEL